MFTRRPDDRGGKRLWNVGQILLDYKAQHARKQSCLFSSPWESEMSHVNSILYPYGGLKWSRFFRSCDWYFIKLILIEVLDQLWITKRGSLFHIIKWNLPEPSCWDERVAFSWMQNRELTAYGPWSLFILARAESAAVDTPSARDYCRQPADISANSGITLTDTADESRAP
jgi:hypothetical protein